MREQLAFRFISFKCKTSQHSKNKNQVFEIRRSFSHAPYILLCQHTAVEEDNLVVAAIDTAGWVVEALAQTVIGIITVEKI